MSAPFNAPTIASRSGIITLPKPKFFVFTQLSKFFFKRSGLESSKSINISANEDETSSGVLVMQDIDGFSDASAQISSTNPPAHGTAVASGTADGQIAWSYEPNDNFYGTDDFDIVVEDALGNLSPITINVIVNEIDDPFFIAFGMTEDELNSTSTVAMTGNSASATFSVTEDETQALHLKIVDDSDGFNMASGLTMSVTPEHGIASTSGGDGVWSYTPSSSYSGSDQFTLTMADDLGRTATWTFEVTVQAADDGGAEATPSAFSLLEDSGPNTITLSLSDPDGIGLGTDGTTPLIQLTSGIYGTASITSTSLDNDGNALVELTFTTDSDRFGTDQLTLHVTDSQGFISDAILTLDIQNIPDPFIIQEHTSSAAILEDGMAAYSLTFSDADGIDQGAAVVSEDHQPNLGIVTLLETENSVIECSYSASSNLHGTDQFGIVLTDKTGQDTRSQDKTRQRQDRTRQENTRQAKTRQNKTIQDKKRQEKTRQDRTRQGNARQGKARQDKSRQE